MDDDENDSIFVSRDFALWVNNGISTAVLSSCFVTIVKEKTTYSLTKVALAQSIVDAVRYAEEILSRT